MADNEESTSTAVIEPESPPVEAPPVLPEEAVPPSEQEQPEGEKPEGDSETPKVEDEAPTLEQVRENALAQIAELAESDPVAAKKLAEKFGVKAADVGDERLTWEREKGEETRQNQWNAALSNYQQYAPVQAKQAITSVFSRLNELMKQAAQDLASGKIESPDALQINPEDWAAQLAPLYEQGQNAAWSMRGADADKANVGAMMGHVAYTHLTSEERTQFHALIAEGKQHEAYTLELDAAIRAAPEEAKKTAKKEADEAAGLLDKYANLKLGVTNSKPSGGPPASGGPTTLEEIDEALRTGPTSDIDGLLAKRAALLNQ